MSEAHVYTDRELVHYNMSSTINKFTTVWGFFETMIDNSIQTKFKLHAKGQLLIQTLWQF